MEMSELQNMWIQHSKDIAENTRINKQILKKVLISQSEKKMNWIKAKAIFNLILPLVLLTTILIPKIKLRLDFSFIVGSILFGIVFIVGYIWAIQYLLKVLKVDFKNIITRTKKDIIELEKFKFRITKLGYMLIPFALIGMFIMLELPFFTQSSLVPIVLIIIVMIVSIYITFRFSIVERFKRINSEIIEIERLETE